MFRRKDFDALIQDHSGPCVSIFLPTHRKAKDVEKDPIRLKNLVRRANEQLIDLGVRPTRARSLLDPITQLVEDEFFWRHQTEGLCIFSAEGLFRYYQESVAFPVLSVVSPDFYLVPMLPLLGVDRSFFVLALSQNQVRFFEHQEEGVRQIEIGSVPSSLSEALIYEEPVSQLQYHSGSPRGAGGSAAVFHGQGVGVDDNKNRILRFLQQVDSGLRSLLNGEQAPLVLAAVDYLMPIYRRVNTYPHLYEEGIVGNPDEFDGEALSERARETLAPYFERPFQDAMQRFGDLKGTGRSSTWLEEIMVAAWQGRVQDLMVNPGRQVWGSYDDHNLELERHDERRPEDRELLNLCAVKVLSMGGAVFVLDAGERPEVTELVASFRY